MIQPEAIEDWKTDLVAPLPGATPQPSELQIEQEGTDFMAAMMAHQSRK